MSVLIFLIPIALFTALLGLAAFLWSLKSKQYEDLQGAASRILFEDEDRNHDQNKPKIVAKK
jgi:cbb3-type cytochrome oxidase maturation protein